MDVFGTSALFPSAFIFGDIHVHLSVFIGLKDTAPLKVVSFALNSQGVCDCGVKKITFRWYLLKAK